MKHVTHDGQGKVISLEIDDAIAKQNSVIVGAVAHLFDSLTSVGFSVSLAADFTRIYMQVLAQKILEPPEQDQSGP